MAGSSPPPRRRDGLGDSEAGHRGFPDADDRAILDQHPGREPGGTAACILAAMDAKPWLVEVGGALRRVDLDVVLIGNAAAALQGAPVTTVDLDFLFRKTARNLRKLKALARALGATILRPYYPASDLYRVVRDADGLQLDFMVTIHGVRSFEGVRARAMVVEIDSVAIRVASLADIIRSKKAAGRPRDVAVLEILKRAHEEADRQAGKARGGRPRR